MLCSFVFLEYWTMDKSKNPLIPSVIHHCQNPIESFVYLNNFAILYRNSWSVHIPFTHIIYMLTFTWGILKHEVIYFYLWQNSDWLIIFTNRYVIKVKCNMAVWYGGVYLHFSQKLCVGSNIMKEFLNKNWTMDNVQKTNNGINMPSSQTFRSYYEGECSFQCLPRNCLVKSVGLNIHNVSLIAFSLKIILLLTSNLLSLHWTFVSLSFVFHHVAQPIIFLLYTIVNNLKELSVWCSSFALHKVCTISLNTNFQDTGVWS
jgi:hypothetical protein